MSKLEVEIERPEPVPRRMTVADIPVGTVFFANITGTPGCAFIRFHHGVMSLENPDYVWTGCDDMQVKGYLPALSAKLIVRYPR